MITVVVADRLGKGQKVAKGIEKAGAKAILVPGIGADMQLGKVMSDEHADFGISFCGSGGAGALTAYNQFGYPCKYSLRSVQEGIRAIEEGAKALGFGFMDSEELGQKLVETYRRKYGNE